MPDKVSIIRNECPTLRCVLELKSWGFFFSFLQVTAERNISLCSRCQAMWLERLKLNATFPLIVKFESDIGMSIIVAFDWRRFKVCGSLRPLLGTLGDDKMLLHAGCAALTTMPHHRHEFSAQRQRDDRQLCSGGCGWFKPATDPPERNNNKHT